MNQTSIGLDNELRRHRVLNCVSSGFAFEMANRFCGACNEVAKSPFQMKCDAVKRPESGCRKTPTIDSICYRFVFSFSLSIIHRNRFIKIAIDTEYLR